MGWIGSGNNFRGLGWVGPKILGWVSKNGPTSNCDLKARGHRIHATVTTCFAQGVAFWGS